MIYSVDYTKLHRPPATIDGRCVNSYNEKSQLLEQSSLNQRQAARAK